MKKFLLAFLFACSCTLTFAAISCGDDSQESSGNTGDSSVVIPLGESRTVTFEEGTGYKILSDVANGGTVYEGTPFTFKLDVGAFYTGSPLVFVNDDTVPADADGVYTVTPGAENLTVRVEGIRKDISNMLGSGTMEDAFVVTKPIDLLYIAEQVNKGNRAYTTGAYVLANDIDCKGEELKVIGDYSTQSAVFSGTFACESTENGVLTRHTISNFVINSENSNYVGLFGAAFADMSLSSTAVFYGIRLENFTINAGVSQIKGDNKTVTCGGLLGYGVGATFFLCDAVNGEVNVVGDQNYFAFVGGLVGYQQGYYDVGYEKYYPTEVNYAVVDVDVNIVGGLALYAGGISGYMLTNTPYGATASVHNSYSLGNVNGALRSGGIAGGMGQYSSVSNCYATGEISARSSQSADSPLLTTDEYCYAYAGGLVGYAENDTVAHDSFFNGSVSSHTVSGGKYTNYGDFIGGGDEPDKMTADAQKYVELNCLTNVDTANSKVYTEKLGWQDYDWEFTDGELPVINYGAPQRVVTLSLTLSYKALDGTEIKVNGNSSSTLKYFDSSIQSLSSYHALGSFFGGGGLSQYYQAQNGYLSYGYFFDEACTQRVPYSYFPEKDVTLYVGFANPQSLLGTYTLFTENSTKPLTITFNANGTATYSDGTTTQSTPYTFDGKNVVLENARLARYYQGEIIVDEEDTTIFGDPNFDLYRYDFYTFKGELSADGSLTLYDGTYFTKDAPLTTKKNAMRGEYFVKNADGVTYYAFYGDSATVEVVPTVGTTSFAEYDTVRVADGVITLVSSESLYAAHAVNASALQAYDEFKGSWVKSATVDKVYTFDGAGNWEYTHVAYDRWLDGYTHSYSKKILASDSGSYTDLGDGSIEFTHGGTVYRARFNDGGALEIVTVVYENTVAKTVKGSEQLFYAEGSYAGKWRGNGYELVLHGIRENGVGEASFIDSEGFVTTFLYENSETAGVIAFYAPLNDSATTKDYLYGYATFDVVNNTLSFILPSDEAESGFATDSLYLFDEYYGAWVTEEETLKDVAFSFNGLGFYSYLNTPSVSGIITLVEDGETTTVKYSLDSAMAGSFVYKTVTYEIRYDEQLQQVVVSLGANASLVRKDELADTAFIDLEGVRYAFDGKSTLTHGTLTVDGETEYLYEATESGYAILSGETEVGSLTKAETHYLLTLNGKTNQLYIENDFMGNWAINAEYTTFEIGPTDLNGVIKANFKGYDVEMTYLDPETLTFFYRDEKMPITYYVFIIYDEMIGEDVLVFSEFTNLLGGDYFICTKANALFGTWEWTGDDGITTMKFDGVSSSYANGYAELSLKLSTTTQIVTEYYYSVRNGGVIMWSREAMAERTWYFRLDLVPASEREEAAKEKDVYVLYGENGEVLQVLRRTEVDGLYLTRAYDAKGVEYFFDFVDGKATILVAGKATYTYEVKSYNANNSASLEVTDIQTGKKYSAELDYADNTHILFTLGEEIVEEQA